MPSYEGPMGNRVSSLFTSSRPPFHPAFEALFPRASIHGVESRIGEDHTAAPPHPGSPLEANRGHCHPARLGVAPVRKREWEDVLFHHLSSILLGLLGRISGAHWST